MKRCSNVPCHVYFHSYSSFDQPLDDGASSGFARDEESSKIEDGEDDTGSEDMNDRVTWNPESDSEKSDECGCECASRGLPELNAVDDDAEKIAGVNTTDDKCSHLAQTAAKCSAGSSVRRNK